MNQAPSNNPGHFAAGAQFDLLGEPLKLERRGAALSGKTRKPSRRDWVEAMDKLRRIERRRDGD